MNAWSVVMTVTAAVSAAVAVSAAAAVAVTAIMAGLAAVGSGAPPVNRVSAAIITHHHALAIDLASAGIALRGGTGRIIVSSLGTGGSEDRKAQGKRHDSEQFFHEVIFSLIFEFGYKSSSHHI